MEACQPFHNKFFFQVFDIQPLNIVLLERNWKIVLKTYSTIFPGRHFIVFYVNHMTCYETVCRQTKHPDSLNEL